MGHKEHEDEKAADAAMANPDVEHDPESIEGQPEPAKEGPGRPQGKPDDEYAG